MTSKYRQCPNGVVEILIKLISSFKAMGTLGPKWGNVGWGMVAFAITVEFIGLTACAIVFLFRHVALLITGVPFWIVAIGCVCATIPTVFLLNFAEMSIWSIIGTFTSIVSAASYYQIDFFGSCKCERDVRDSRKLPWHYEEAKFTALIPALYIFVLRSDWLGYAR